MCPHEVKNMINQKSDLSGLSKALRKSIVDSGQTIKLASIRESIAKAAGYKSVNGMLSKLPFEFNETFWDQFANILKANYRVTFDTPIWTIEYPENHPLSANEKLLIWNDAQKAAFVPELMESLSETMLNLKTLRPDGSGGWHSSESIHPMLESIPGFRVSAPPELKFDVAWLSKEQIQAIADSLKETCFDYWNKESNFFIQSKIAKLFEGYIVFNDQPLNMSSTLDITVGQFVKKYSSAHTTGRNPFASIPSPFVQSSYEHLNDEIRISSIFPNELSQEITGSCIYNKQMGFDYENKLWKPLVAIAESHGLIVDTSGYSPKYFEAFSTLLWSDEFLEAINHFTLEWLAKQDDWNKNIRDIIYGVTRKSYQPKEDVFPRAVCRGMDIYSIESNARKTEQGTYKETVEWYSQGKDCFWSANEYWEEHGGYEEEPFFYDKARLKSEILQNKESLKTYRDEVIKYHFDEGANPEEEAIMAAVSNYIDQSLSDSEYEEKNIWEEEQDNKKYHVPFTEPFDLKSIHSQLLNSDNQVICSLKTDLYIGDPSHGPIDFRYHWTMMDEMSRESSEVASYMRRHEEFDVDTLLYVNMFYFYEAISAENLSNLIVESMINPNSEFEEIVLFGSYAFHAAFPGQPYSGCQSLNDEFKAFLDELRDNLAKNSIHCGFISMEEGRRATSLFA